MNETEARHYARWLLHSTNESRTTQSFLCRMVSDRTGLEPNLINRSVQRCAKLEPSRAVQALTADLWMGAEAAA